MGPRSNTLDEFEKDEMTETCHIEQKENMGNGEESECEKGKKKCDESESQKAKRGKSSTRGKGKKEACIDGYMCGKEKFVVRI